MIPGLHSSYKQKRTEWGRTKNIVREGDGVAEGLSAYDRGRKLRVKLIALSLIISLAILKVLLARRHF